MNYTIKKAANGSNVLQVNGRDCICPFRTPLMMQVATGQHIKTLTGETEETRTAKMSEICSDTCPLFAVHAQGYSVELHCGKGREIVIDKPGKIKVQA